MGKKVLALLVLIGLIITAGFTNNINVYIGNKRIEFPDQQPFIDENNRILVPVRFVAENLGAEVGWNQERKEVVITNEDIKICLIIGENKARVNDEEIVFDTAAEIHNGRTMVPLRFIVNVFGRNIAWNQFTKTVYILDPIDNTI